MSSERVGPLRGTGEVFSGETKIADADFDIAMSQEYTEVHTQDSGSGRVPNLQTWNGTIKPKNGRFPLTGLLTLHFEGKRRLNFYVIGQSIKITGGPYEAE